MFGFFAFAGAYGSLENRTSNSNTSIPSQRTESFEITKDYMTHYCYNVGGACSYNDYWEVIVNNTGTVPITNVVASASRQDGLYNYTSGIQFLVDVVQGQNGQLQGVAVGQSNPLLPNHIATLIDNYISFGYGDTFNVSVTVTFSDGTMKTQQQTVTEAG